MQHFIQLRKLRDFGASFSETLQFLKFNWKKLLVLYAVFVVPILLVAVLLGSGSFAALFFQFAGLETSGFSGLSEIFGIKLWGAILLYLLATASFATVLYLYMRLYEEKGGVQPDINEIGKLYLPKLMTNFAISILICLGLGVITFVLVLIPILGWLILFVGFFYLMVTFALVYPINTIESNDIITSIKRSFVLIRNRWWYSFGYMIILVMIYYFFATVIGLIVNLIFGFTSVNYVDPGNTNVFTKRYFLVTGISSIIQQVFYLIIYIGIGIHYYTLREEKEGTGLEDRLEQLGGGDGLHGQIEEQY